MQRRGRPSTQPPKLRDGFYIELRAHGSSSAIKIIRKTWRRLTLFKCIQKIKL